MLNKLFLFPILLLLAMWQPCTAQQTMWQPMPVFTPIYTHLVLNSTPYQNTALAFTPNTSAGNIRPAANYTIHYVLPKGAIFCRMEDALYKHFNFWIKFRMGNDDRYSD